MLLFPHLIIVFLLTVISAVGLIVVFSMSLEETPWGYAVYPLSAYSVTVLCLACVKTIPDKYRSIKGKVFENKYASRYLTDRAYKMRIDLYRSLILNILFVAFNVVSSFIYKSGWFSIFAGYYALMAIMRFLLVRYAKHNEIGAGKISEYKRSRVCACFLMAVNVSLISAVYMMIFFDRGFSYRGMLIYVMAAYTFYITTMSIIDFLKCRKHNSTVIATSAAIRLAAALGSMLFLETAMFAQFGSGDVELQHRMIMITGAGIVGVVIAIAVVMIVRSTKAIKRIKLKQGEENSSGQTDSK